MRLHWVIKGRHPLWTGWEERGLANQVQRLHGVYTSREKPGIEDQRDSYIWRLPHLCHLLLMFDPLYIIRKQFVEISNGQKKRQKALLIYISLELC